MQTNCLGQVPSPVASKGQAGNKKAKRARQGLQRNGERILCLTWWLPCGNVGWSGQMLRPFSKGNYKSGLLHVGNYFEFRKHCEGQIKHTLEAKSGPSVSSLHPLAQVQRTEFFRTEQLRVRTLHSD